MINANELRIGNWVSFKGMWIGQVKKFTDDVILINGNDGVFDIESFEGVPVTEELLYKAGALDFADGESLILYNRLISSVTSIPLHQLQNLYFSYTGKELIFSPDYLATPAPSHKSL